jgi:hypothetical protein
MAVDYFSFGAGTGGLIKTDLTSIPSNKSLRLFYCVLAFDYSAEICRMKLRFLRSRCCETRPDPYSTVMGESNYARA